MKVINNFPKRGGYLPYSFSLTVLLNFAGGCKGQKIISPLPSLEKVETNLTNASDASAPSLEKVEANFLRSSGSPSSLSNVVPNNSSSGKEGQASIMSRLDTIEKEDKECREAFSQALSPIKDLSERDKMIASFVEKSKFRIETFNLLLKKVVDPNIKQRLIKSFQDIDRMCEEVNLLNHQFNSTNPTELRKQCQKRGDIIEKYNNYEIESKRQQFRRRVENLMKFVVDNPSIFPNKQEQGTECAICHASGSVGLLPCGDCVHAQCLVEEMIFVWRQGYEFALTCPGSCGNLIAFHYFLFDDQHVKTYLTQHGLKKIFWELSR